MMIMNTYIIPQMKIKTKILLLLLHSYIKN